MDNGQKELEKVCGFDKEPCIEDKCAFWAEVLQGTQLGAPKKVGMCVFQAILLVTGSPKPQFQQVPLDKMGLKV